MGLRLVSSEPGMYVAASKHNGGAPGWTPMLMVTLWGCYPEGRNRGKTLLQIELDKDGPTDYKHAFRNGGD